MVTAYFGPVAPGGDIKRQRRRAASGDLQKLSGNLALGALYRLRFPTAFGFRRAVKATTSHLEVELIERAALRFVDRHMVSLRVRFSMNSLMSDSAYMRLGFFSPLPTLTYRISPARTCADNVFVETFRQSAAWAGVISGIIIAASAPLQHGRARRAGARRWP